jgi:hypothetical protein
MSTEGPKTVDDLGIDVSRRYIRDQEQLDRSFIKDFQIPSRTQVVITTPFYASETDSLVGAQKRVSWFLSSPPENYSISRKKIFSYQLIPSLGPNEKLDEDLSKIENFKIPKNAKNRKALEKDKDTLKTFLQTYKKIEDDLRFVNIARKRYAKG